MPNDCGGCVHWLFAHGGTDGMCAHLGVTKSAQNAPSHVPAYYPSPGVDSYVGVKRGHETVEVTDDEGQVTGTQVMDGWYRGLITHTTHTCAQWEAIDVI